MDRRQFLKMISGLLPAALLAWLSPSSSGGKVECGVDLAESDGMDYVGYCVVIGEFDSDESEIVSLTTTVGPTFFVAADGTVIKMDDHD